MKRLLALIALVGTAALAVRGQIPAPRIVLDAPDTITAGDAWALTVQVEDAAAGVKANALLINGLRRASAELTFGTGGIARWMIPAGEIVAAGRALVVVRSGEAEARRSLTVLPGDVSEVEILTTTNTLPAYSVGRASIIAFAADEWGNAVAAVPDAAIWVGYPNGQATIRPLITTSLLYHEVVRSLGLPGRLRIEVSISGERTRLELLQTPDEADHIELTVQPDCIRAADSRDVITLEATVTDRMGSAVADGTRVIFAWSTGEAYALTLNGRASMRLPAPSVTRTYTATAGSVRSRPVNLRIGQC